MEQAQVDVNSFVQNDGGYCPKCNSPMVDAQGCMQNGAVPMRCADGGATWNELYELVGTGAGYTEFYIEHNTSPTGGTSWLTPHFSRNSRT